MTGTEVLTGRVTDRNGPWLAEQLRILGVDIAHVLVVGDRPDDLHSALAFMASTGVQLIITSGGLGPTADDLTAEVVGGFQGRASALDAALEDRITAIVAKLSAGRGWHTEASVVAAATRKQALVPAGASVLEPVGTAPGLVVPVAEGRSGPPVLVLPGPPWELQRMWPAALSDALVAAALGDRVELRQQTIRIWGHPEAELAAVLRDNSGSLDELEITTCLRSGELEVVTRYGSAAQPAYDVLQTVLVDAFADSVFSTDARTVDQIVAAALLARGLTIATAESCTAGLLAARLTDLAGSSAYVLGGLVVYSNAAKASLAGVDPALIESVGAVSAEVAAALASGARTRLGTDLGVGITGIAGPDGGTPDKPVGLVHLALAGPDSVETREVNVPGGRADVRSRTVLIAMHMIRRFLGS